MNAPIPSSDSRARHPAALLLLTLLVAAGVSFARGPVTLGLVAAIFGVLALRAEGKRPRAEWPLWGLALLLFAAHAAVARFEAAALRTAALLSLRLLALVYLVRWAARTYLPAAARWLLGLRLPSRPRGVALAAESARLAAAVLPVAAREAEAQTWALRARGIGPGRGLTGRARFVAAWLLPMLGTMLRVGDALADALQARGYVPGMRRPSVAAAPWGALDALLVGAGVLSAAVLLRGV